MKITRNIDLNIKETLEVGDSIKLKFEDGIYELVEQNEETLIFKIKNYNKYSKLSIEDLGDTLECLREEYERAENECSEYNSRVNEFRYCGYNEEDPDFHGMCLHLSGLEDKCEELDNEINNIINEIEKRCNYDYEKINGEYGIDI